MLKEMTFDITLLLKTLNDDRYQVKLLVWKMKQQNMKKKKNYLNKGIYIFTYGNQYNFYCTSIHVYGNNT